MEMYYATNQLLLTAGSARLNQVLGQLIGVQGAAKAGLCGEKRGRKAINEQGRMCGSAGAAPASKRGSTAGRDSSPPTLQLTGIGHDGQEVVAGHLALGVLNLVGALQRLRLL